MGLHTVFTRIVAVATINFSLIPVRLLIEGGYYSGCGYYSSKYGTYVHTQHLLLCWNLGNRQHTVTRLSLLRLATETARHCIIYTGVWLLDTV